MIRARVVFLAFLCCAFSFAAGFAFAQNDRADIRYETVAPNSIGLDVTYRLRIRCEATPEGALRIAGREDYLGIKEIRKASDPDATRYLRRGDVITHVDGVRIDSFDAYYRAMRSSGGTPRLTVVEADTGESEDWLIDAERELMPLIAAPTPDRTPQEDGIVRAILVAPTDDPVLGVAAEKTIAKVRDALESALPPGRLQVVTVSGAACDARGILRQVDQVVCRDRDTLFVYVVARAGFDARYAVTEESPLDALPVGDVESDDGEFFYLHEGDLLRRSLWERMATREARLTVLVTETGVADSTLDQATTKLLTPTASERSSSDANDSEAEDSHEPNVNSASRRGWAARLLGTTGQVDVRIGSPSQTGWFDPVRGGWFAEALLDSTERADREGEGDWQALLKSASQAANDRYAERRDVLLKSADGLSATAKARLNAQTELVGEIRKLAVERDETLDHLPATAD